MKKMLKVLCLALCLSMTVMLLSMPTVLADETAAVTVSAQIPGSTEGVVAALEGSDAGSASLIGNDGWTSISSKYNLEQGTTTLNFNSTSNDYNIAWLKLPQAFASADVKKMVVALKVSSSVDLNIYYYNRSGTGAGINESRKLVASFTPETEFKEYVLDVSQLPGWDTSVSYDTLRLGTGTVKTSVEIAYIRFVTNAYNFIHYYAGTPVANYSENYNRNNNIVDFKFSAELDFNTVKGSNVSVNGSPAKYTIMSDNATNAFRVNLGILKKNMRYRISFPGVKTSAGGDIDAQFVFDTAVEAPLSSVEMKLPSASVNGIVGGFDAADEPIAGITSGAWMAANCGTASGYWSRDGWTSAKFMYNQQHKTVDVNIYSNVDSSNFATLITSPVNRAQVKNVVIGVKASQNAPMNMYYWDSTKGGVSGSRVTSFSFEKSDCIKEYVLDVSKFANWTGQDNYNRFRFDAKPDSYPIDLEFAYVRFVSAEYTDYMSATPSGTIVENNSTEYNEENNIVDFSFPEALDYSTVKPENITVNGKPAKLVTVPSSGIGNSFRANLGKLKKNTSYTVKFPGMQTVNNPYIDAEVNFSTTAVPQVDNVTAQMKIPGLSSGIAGGYEGSNPQSGTWNNDGWSAVKFRHSEAKETMTFTYTSTDSRYSMGYLKFNNTIDTSGVSKVIIGAKADEDITLNIYYSGPGAGVSESRKISNVAISGSGAFTEYAVNTSSLSAWNTLTGGCNALRIDRAAGGTEFEVAYIRFVTDSYTGLASSMSSGTSVDNFDTSYSKENSIVDFVFPYDLDLSAINASNVTINGASAKWVMTSPDVKNGFRANLGTLTNITRYRVKFNAIQNSDNANLITKQIVFTTDAAISPDSSKLSVPITTFELVSGFETENETPLNLTLPSGVVSAVTGGLYNPGETEVTYSVVLALYNNGRLEDIKYKAVTLAGGAAAGQQCLELTVPDNSSNYGLKAFAFDSNSLVPITLPITPETSGFCDNVATKQVKLLIVGNSITVHEPYEAIGWTGNWGMAASALDKDYVHVLSSSLKRNVPLLDTMIVNAANAERIGATEIDQFNPGADGSTDLDTLMKTTYKSALDFDADIILFTIGANCNESEFTSERYGKIVSAFNPTGKAKVVAGVTTITPGSIDAAIKEYAAANNVPCVDMNFSKSENPEFFPTSEDFANEGICLHPNDAGMAEMANRLEPEIWKVIKSYNLPQVY